VTTVIILFSVDDFRSFVKEKTAKGAKSYQIGSRIYDLQPCLQQTGLAKNDYFATVITMFFRRRVSSGVFGRCWMTL